LAIWFDSQLFDRCQPAFSVTTHPAHFTVGEIKIAESEWQGISGKIRASHG